MKIQILTYISVLASLVWTSGLKAQDNPQTTPPGSGTLTEEIEVVRPYRPVLADAVKIRRNPDMKNEQVFKPSLTYSIIDKKLELNSNIKELQAQQLQDEQLAVLSNNYVKGAAGNLGTALGEIFVNTGRDEGLQAGAFFKHISQQGDLEKQQFSNQEIGVFGKSVLDGFSVNGRVMYDRRSTFFYGYNPAFTVPPSFDKQRFSTFSGQAELTSNYAENSDLDYGLHLKAYHFANISEARESSAILGGSVNKKMNAFNIGLNASADFTSVKDAAYNMGNSFLRANPYIKLQVNAFLLNIGANLVQEFGDRSRTNVFPAVSAELPVVAGYATVFGGVNGDVLKTSVRDLSIENPFLNSNLSIRNTLEKLNIYAGIKGNAGAEFGYKVMGFYKNVDDLLLFVNNQTLVNKFDAVYDNGTSNIFGLDGQISVKASSVLDLTAQAQVFNYELASEKEAWFKPGLRLTSNARLKIGEKLDLDGELVFQGETMAKTFSTGFPATEQTVKVKSFMDVSAGASYKVNGKIGVFLRANNLLGQTYQKYLYYSRLGLNVFGGLNYSF